MARHELWLAAGKMHEEYASGPGRVGDPRSCWKFAKFTTWTRFLWYLLESIAESGSRSVALIPMLPVLAPTREERARLPEAGNACPHQGLVLNESPLREFQRCLHHRKRRPLRKRILIL
jgi:hypothetical protein